MLLKTRAEQARLVRQRYFVISRRDVTRSTEDSIKDGMYVPPVNRHSPLGPDGAMISPVSSVTRYCFSPRASLFFPRVYERSKANRAISRSARLERAETIGISLAYR